jgi:hypothetical protein
MLPVFVNMLVNIQYIPVVVGQKFGNRRYKAFPVLTVDDQNCGVFFFLIECVFDDLQCFKSDAPFFLRKDPAT